MSNTIREKSLEEVFGYVSCSRENDEELMGLGTDQLATNGEIVLEPEMEKEITDHEPVGEVEIKQAIVDQIEETKAVERAIIFLSMNDQMEAERIKFGRESDQERNGVVKAWEVIKQAVKRVVDALSTFFIKMMNFIRKGGLKEKIVIIQGNKIPAKNIGPTITVPNPKCVQIIIDLFKKKFVPIKMDVNSAKEWSRIKPNWLSRLDLPSKMKEKVLELHDDKQTLVQAMGECKKLCTEQNMHLFESGMKETLDMAKRFNSEIAHTNFMEDLAEALVNIVTLSVGEADKITKEMANANLVEINAMQWLAVRGFSWFITITNAVYSILAAPKGIPMDMKMSMGFGNGKSH